MNEIEKWHRQLGAYGICLHEGNLLVIKKGGGPYIGRFDLPGGTIGDLATNPEMFEGQDSLGALWIPISDFSTDNSSPLVLQAIDWLKTRELPLDVQRLDDWVVKELIN